MGITLKEGRNFTLDSETDHKESVIITEGLARKFGILKPIGKEIIWMDTAKYFVVGVVKDIYNNGLWEQMEPIMFRYGSKDNVNHILVKAPVDKLVAVNQYMEATWKELFPNKMYDSNYMNDEMVEANTVNKNLVTMFVFLLLTGRFLEMNARRRAGAAVEELTEEIITTALITAVAEIAAAVIAVTMGEGRKEEGDSLRRGIRVVNS